MKNLCRKTLALLIIALGIPSLTHSQATENNSARVSPSESEQNKQLLLDFFEFTGTQEERAERFLSDNYVQHNPRFLRMNEITGASGRQAWLEAIDEARQRDISLVELGGIQLRNPIILMAEDDLVTAIYRGTLPDPDNPVNTYEAFAFEAFRVEDGKFTEHWDQVTLVEGWMSPSNQP